MAEDPSVREIRTNTIIHLEKTQSVYEAACLMKKNNVTSVVVLDKNAIAGIITEKDIVQKVVCSELNPRQTTAEQVMTTPVNTVDVNQSVVEAARLMRQKKIKHLIVTDGRDVKGIITQQDIIDIYPALNRPDALK